MSTVEPNFKTPPIDCPCGCGATGQPLRNGHVRACPPATCASCRNRANRQRGRTNQRKAHKLLGVPKAKQSGTLGNEESWRHPQFRWEVKGGKQVGPIATRFLLYEAQSEASHASGDARRFGAVAMPEGWKGDGLVIVRLSTWRDVIVPLLEESA